MARRIGLKVREETLLREVGYHVRSGRCRIRGEDVVIIDRNLPASDRLEILLEAVGDRDVETHYLTPALRQLLERRGDSAA